MLKYKTTEEELNVTASATLGVTWKVNMRAPRAAGSWVNSTNQLMQQKLGRKGPDRNRKGIKVK